MTSSSDFIINQGIHNLPYNIGRCSHIFEHKPSEHNSKVSFEFKLDPGKLRTPINEKLCLFERGNTNPELNDDLILNYWTAHSPVEDDHESIKFELKSCFYVFLGSLDYMIEEANLNIENQFKLIKPGLNYLLTCSIEDCRRPAALMIINREFGEFKPCHDIIELKCPYCGEEITTIDSIKSFIVYKSTGRIEYRFKTIQRIKAFSIKNNKIGFFNYNVDIRNFVIKICKNLE
jgi:hypothetical protein